MGGRLAVMPVAEAGSRLWHAGFRPGWWDVLARRAERRAVATVPYYRERWAFGPDPGCSGRPCRPAPVPAGELADQLERLCPLARPWRPDREPSLWIGRPGPLRTALALAGLLAPGLPKPARPPSGAIAPGSPAPGPPGPGVPGPGVPVLEVRRALVDWCRLGPVGPPYAVLLAEDAEVASAARHAALTVPAAALAVRAGRALLVGPPEQLPAAASRLRQALDDSRLPLLAVHRCTAAAAAAGPAPDRPALLHDPYLGYFGAAVPSCGEYHLDWTRFHARAAPGGVALTALHRRRPTLVAVQPAEPGFTAVTRCARHRSPVLVR
ncbi:MAG TPA: hypothetical protein VMU51_22470 [Mycobacteriales bacterium]|nr:hypothetical protein [Mycobacteriales bacterium]